jgi:hypothetical protein
MSRSEQIGEAWRDQSAPTMVGARGCCDLISPAVFRAHLHEPETCKRRKYLYPGSQSPLASSTRDHFIRTTRKLIWESMKSTLNQFVHVTSVFWSSFRMGGGAKEPTGRGGWPKHWHQNRKRTVFKEALIRELINIFLYVFLSPQQWIFFHKWFPMHSERSFGHPPLYVGSLSPPLIFSCDAWWMDRPVQGS